MDELVYRFFSILDDNVIEAIQVLARASGPFPWMSACSGTESPAWVTRAVQRALSRLGVDVSFSHRASAEISASKRSFVLDTASSTDFFFFLDMQHMLRSEAPNAASESREHQPVDLLGMFIFICGFSCKSASNLNTSQAEKTGLCSDTDTSTGLTFDYVLRIARRWRPLCIILENVPAPYLSQPGRFL